MKSRNYFNVGLLSLPNTDKIGYVLMIRNGTDFPFSVIGSVTILPGHVVSFTWTTVGWIIERTLNP